MLKKRLFEFFLTILLGCVCACSGSIEMGKSSPTNGVNDYKIRPGDIIEIRFQHYPDFNQTLVVSAQGTLALRMIGVLRVNDLTLDIFKEIILEKYGQMLAEPRLSVSVVQSSNYNVYINGDIKNPGVLRVRGALTVAEGIIMAGGLKDAALDYEVIVLRNRGDGVKIHKLEIKKNNLRELSKRDFKLIPFDVIYVKKSSTNQSQKNTKHI